tara:strand:- start:1015 stop:1683 length:669 start_codon:yes stop_codon:yes gene_type:complete
MVNPYDEFAVEQAVQFKEAEGGKVTLISLFSEDNSIDTDLRKMLAIGADEIIVLRQNDYRGDKPLANAKILSDAIKELDVDLVLCGIQGIDYYQAATGTMVAQMLDMPNVSGVTDLEYNAGTLKAKRQIEGGLQTIETSTPAVVTCQKDMNKVRFPALKDIMMSKRKPFENKKIDSLESNDVVTSESSLPPARDGGEIIEGDSSEEKVDKLIEKLKMEAKVI